MSTTEVLNERDRVRAISALFDKHGISQGTKQHYIENGNTIDQARRFVLDQIPPQSPIGTMPPGGFESSDFRDYSLAKVFRSPPSELRGFERQVHEQLYESLPEFRRRGVRGTLVPLHQLNWGKRSVMNKTNFSEGGALTQTVLDGSRFVDRLRERSMVMSMGPTVIEGQASDLDLPRQTSDAEIFWIAEGEPLGDTNLQFDRIQFRPKTCGSIITYTRSLLQQSSIELENTIRNDLVANVATALDRSVLNGIGGKMPLGLFNRPELEMSPSSANGDQLSLEVLCEMERLVSNDNADKGSLGYLCNPNLRKKAKLTTENSSNVSKWLWQNGPDGDQRMGIMNGYPAAVSNAIPNNFEAGTSTDCNGLVFGDWSALYIVFFGLVEVLANPYGTGFSQGSVSIRILSSFDCNIRNNESFVLSRSIKS